MSTKNNIELVVVDKTVQVPISIRGLLVQGDHASRKILITINRYYDGIDLSTKDFHIVFENKDGETGYYGIDKEYVEIKDDILSIQWWVDGSYTAIEGEVKTQLEINEKDEVLDIIYRYQTIPFTMYVEKTVIANGNTNLPDYYLDIRFYEENQSPVEYEMVSSLGTVQIEGREIIMPVYKDIVVTQDTRSRIVSFVIPRYFDYVDLSDKAICIKFRLKDGTGDRSFVCNKTISDTMLKFDWLIDGRVTLYEGEVAFSVEFIGYNEKNEFFCWNTVPAYLKVSKGLDTDTMIEQPNPSWIQSWNILADQYLRDYSKYLQQIKDNLNESNNYAKLAKKYAEQAKASEISAENDANIAWQQANRSERAANAANADKMAVSKDKTDFDKKYKAFLDALETLRSTDDPIELTDLSITLQNFINSKADKDHSHTADEVQETDNRIFLTPGLKTLISQARQDNTPITEDDLDSALALKVNQLGGGSGGSGGVVITGVQIDDTDLSWSKTWSSQHIDQNIKNATAGLVQSETNKGLSANDFSDYYRKKLDSVDENANYFDAGTLSNMKLKIFMQEPDFRTVSDTEKISWSDKYTKDEVDNLLSALSTGLIWKDPVSSVSDIAIKYPYPENNWTVNVTDTGDSYTYNGTSWVKFSSGTIPIATPSNHGLFSQSDKAKLDSIAYGANQYVLPQLTSDDLVDGLNSVVMTKADKSKLDNMESYMESELDNYRKTSVQLVEADLSPALLNKLMTTNVGLLNDTTPSMTQTYSSVKIESALNDFVDNNTMDESDMEGIFSGFGYEW